MNSIKFKRIKEEIMMADQICSDISLKTILKRAEYIIQSDMPEDEIKKFYNRFGEQLALASEHYLKSIIISRMHFESITEESEDELNKIFDNRYGGRRNDDSIANKYSHYFDRLLTSDNTALLHSPGLQESILIRLAEKLGISEFGLYKDKQFLSWINEDETEIDLAKEELLRKIKERVNDNKSAYPESRYGMFTTYRADLQFLTCLCSTLQEYPARTLNNCIFINGFERHIYPDDESVIYEKRSDGTNITYRYSNNKLDIIECNGVKKEELSQYQQFNDLFPNITKGQAAIIEINYIENGELVTIKYDQMLNCFCKSKNINLQKEVFKSKK